MGISFPNAGLYHDVNSLCIFFIFIFEPVFSNAIELSLRRPLVRSVHYAARRLQTSFLYFFPKIAKTLCGITAVRKFKYRLLMSSHFFYITQIRNIIFEKHFIHVKFLYHFMVHILAMIDHAKKTFYFILV